MRDQRRVSAVLESIADSHLVEAGAFGSYRYDPLVKLHAWRMALEIDGPLRCERSRELLARHGHGAFPAWVPDARRAVTAPAPASVAQ